MILQTSSRSRKHPLIVTLLWLIPFLHSMDSQTKPNLAKRTEPGAYWVRQTLRLLSLEEKVGQTIMPAFRGVYFANGSPEFREIRRQIDKNHVGGFILFAGDVYESAVLIDKMQTKSKLPLLIASDFERGANFRIRNTVSFPWNMAVGATGSEHWAYIQGKITAQEARAMGVNWILGPVLDINNNPANPVINIRSYGEDPQLVARLGAAFIRGVQDSGVLATGKHFPGHGDTSVDSHLQLPLLSADRERLEKLELIPFKRAIESGVWSILTAHLAVPALEPNSDIPATLSSKVLRGVLQQELGFSRIIVTDSLTMAGLTNGFWTGDTAVRGVKAGVDVLLDPPNPDVAFQALLGAVKSGDISEERLNRSVEKILRAKAWLGLPMSKKVDLDAIGGLVDDPNLQEQAQQVADASIVLVSDPRQLLPFDVRRTRSVHVILVLGRDQQEDTAIFQQELRRRVEAERFDKISLASPDSELAKVLERAKSAERIICAVFARLVTGTGTVCLPEKLANWVNQLIALKPPTVIIVFGNPYLLQQLPQATTSLCTFSNADVSQVSAVRAIFGEIPVNGRLPVSIPGVADIYSGVERPKLDMKLKDGMSEEFQPVQEHLKTLDNLIEQSIRGRAFPGASVSIGYQGSLIYQKAFGKFDYSQNGKPVAMNTLYDLASLTKVVAATTLAMQLYESGDLKLEFPVSRFYPPFTGGARERITIKHLLTHTSGLPAHLAFYKDTQGKSEFVKKILTTPLEYEPGAKMIYSDLGVILLGDILEKITAKPMDVLAHSRIFAPLGMDHTLFKPGEQLKAQIAPTENDPWRDRLIQGEVHDENAYAMGGVSAHAGLFSNSGDLAIFCQMLLNGGVYNHHRLMKRSTLEQFVARQDFPAGSSRALGWDTPSEGSSAGSLLPSTSFGHTGFTGTSIWLDPTRQLFIILLTNRVYPTRENNAILEVRRQVADAVVRAVEEAHH